MCVCVCVSMFQGPEFLSVQDGLTLMIKALRSFESFINIYLTLWRHISEN